MGSYFPVLFVRVLKRFEVVLRFRARRTRLIDSTVTRPNVTYGDTDVTFKTFLHVLGLDEFS